MATTAATGAKGAKGATGAGKLRLGVAATLFIAWLGWLLYLALGSRQVIVLSRPQFLVANLWIIADVVEKNGRPAAELTVRELVWSEKPRDLVGAAIVVADLPSHGPALGWSGPGRYILSLTEVREGKKPSYRVTPLPASPGFVPGFHTVTILAEGKEKDKVRDLVAQFSGLDRTEVDRLLTPPARASFHNVTEADARLLETLKAVVRFQREESRIYAENDETRSQLNDLPRR